jgi:hypothetical protein
MPDKTWKVAERKVSKLLGGQRAGAVGREGADVIHPHLSVEVKERRRLPDWLLHAMAQAVGAADGRLPMVVLHRAGDRYEDAMVIVRMRDWIEWYGDVQEA